MNRKTQKWIVNIALGLWIFFGAMIAVWIFDASAEPTGDSTCRGWHGHKVACNE